jgi:hypothetical protein
MIGLGLLLVFLRLEGGDLLRLRLWSDCDVLRFGEGEEEREVRLRRTGESESDLAGGGLLPFLTGDDSVFFLPLPDGAVELLSCDCERVDCAEVALELVALLLLTVGLSSAGWEALLVVVLVSSGLGWLCWDEEEGERTAGEPKWEGQTP